MSIDFLTLAHDKLAHLVPYQPGKSIQSLQKKSNGDSIIKLASNENPLGPSPLAIEATQQSAAQVYRYPDGNQTALKLALANHHDCDMNQITIGGGSENIISMLIQAFNRQNRHILMPKYSFSAYKINAKAHNAEAYEVESGIDSFDIDNIIKKVTKDTALLFMANPNNPTGHYFNNDDLQKLLSHLPKETLLILDEAYYDYAKETADYPDSESYLKDFDNLVILRTFSKIYGLAGLRIGYSLSHASVANALNRVRLPFNISLLAETAAIKALEDKSHIKQSLKINREGKQQYIDAFKQMGLKTLPSVTNFITVDMQKPTAELEKKLLSQGIILRTLYPYDMANYLRITIGLKEENERVIHALKHYGEYDV